MKRLLGLFCCLAATAAAAPAHAVEAPVRGLILKAKRAIVMDGKLDEWAGAFQTPVNFGHADWQNRAAVWHYLWDDQNLYIGLECLDTTLFNAAPGNLYNGDGVEFYLDLREGDQLGAKEWSAGALHMFFAPASNGEIKPRMQIRPGLPHQKDFTTQGMECAAAKTAQGWSLEFRLPWSKFPGFKPTAGREIGIDCELCSSDGGPRVDRCWVFGGVADVGSPSAQGRVRLVDSWDPADASAYSPVLFPSFVAKSTPLDEAATLFVAVPPALHVTGVQMTAGGKKLPFVGLKQFGPGWTRAQACLVGFTSPADTSVEVTFTGDGGKVLGKRTVSLK